MSMSKFEQLGTYNLTHIKYTKKKAFKAKKAEKRNRLESLDFQWGNFSETPIRDSNEKYSCVYIVQHKRSGCFYIGVHTDRDPYSVWKTYFTSSNVVASIIAVDGADSFEVKKLFYAPSRALAERLESYLIFHNQPRENLHILNKAYGIGKDHTITDWKASSYGDQRIAVNPQCKILTEDTNDDDLTWYTLPKNLGKKFVPSAPKIRMPVAREPEKKVHRIAASEMKHLI